MPFAVAAARAFPAARRRQQPPAGRGGIEEGAEAGRRVEARQAQPVDGAFGADQGSGVQIADHCVILDAYHDTYSATPASPRHGGGSTVEGARRRAEGEGAWTGHVAAVRIGTSGWSYDHWENVLYPPGLPARDRLAHYAARFDTVELNASFYRWPRDDSFASWRRRLPRRFRCCPSRRPAA